MFLTTNFSLDQLLRSEGVSRGDTVLDLSPSLSAAATWAAAKVVGPTGEVFAFQPNIEHARSLESERARRGCHQVKILHHHPSTPFKADHIILFGQTNYWLHQTNRWGVIEKLLDQNGQVILIDWLAERAHPLVQIVKQTSSLADLNDAIQDSLLFIKSARHPNPWQYLAILAQR